MKRKPKPRPAYKIRPAAEDGAAPPTAPSTSTIISVLTPVVPAPQSLTDPIETATTISGTSKGKQKATEDDIGSFSLDIAERAKIRSRGKTATKTPIVDPDDIIELTSGSEDELLLFPSESRTKDKPRRATAKKETPSKKAAARKSPAKKAKTSHQQEPPDSTPITLPVPTSDPAPSSQLPPSDPPLPSSANPPATSAYALNPSPPLSPLPGPSVHKRKRPVHAGSDDEGDHALAKTALVTTASAELMPPPPPLAFFASSSQPPGPSNANETFGPQGELVEPSVPVPKAKTKGKKKAANDEDEDWAGDEPKPKAKGRKKRTEEEEDEDWDGKPKPKAKRAPRRKKGEAAVSTEGTAPDAVSSAEYKKKAPRPRKKAQAAAEVTEGVESAELGATPAEPPKKAPARGRGKRKVEVFVEVPSPVKRSTKTHDNAQDDEPPAPEPVPQPEESELSALESDLEGKKAALASKPSTSEQVSSDKPGASNTKGKGKGKKRALVLSDEEDDAVGPSSPTKAKGKARVTPDDEDNAGGEPSPKKAKGKAKATLASDDEQDNPSPAKTLARKDAPGSSLKDPLPRTPAPRPSAAPSSSASIMRSASHQIPKAKGVSMSELIRRASQAQGSPIPSQVYSPLVKMSRSTLRSIAPLHTNRKPPPPPPPRAPPPKKTKKELELEEKWDMELEDETPGWHALPNEERARLRRMKRDAYYGFDD